MKRTLIGPFKQIVTMEELAPCGPLREEELFIINDGGILIEGEKIREVAPFRELERVKHELLIPLKTPSVALPGFVDAHTHICWAGSRMNDYLKRLEGYSYQEIAAAGGGILHTVRQTRQASLAELAALTRMRADRLFKNGVTTCEVKSGYGLSRADELKILRAIKTVDESHPISLVATCLAAHLRPPEWRTNSEYLNSLVNELLPQIKSEGLSGRVDIFVEEGAFSVDEARDYLLQAQAMGFDLCLHADQFTTGGSLLAVEVGALSADHLEASGEAEMEALQVGGVIPIVLPGASLGLGVPFAPARALLDSQLPLVIASDWNPGSAPMGNLLLQAAILGAAEKLTIAETLAAITCRAARALKLEDRAILAPGYRADIAIFPTDHYANIFYTQGMLQPNAVVASGEYYA